MLDIRHALKKMTLSSTLGYLTLASLSTSAERFVAADIAANPLRSAERAKVEEKRPAEHELL